jgi:DNA primase
MDRSLTRLAPGRSFCFALVAGGKDPDDILREQGAAALKAQLGQTTPFVEALFIRERDAANLETPEGRAGLKQRLRAAAKSIADADLATAYRDDLFGRLDALLAQRAPPPARPAGGGARPWKRGAPPPLEPPRPGSRAAADRLARDLDPVAAALAWQAVADPGVLEDHLEAVEQAGFGDPALDELAKEIIRVRLSCEHLDTAALKSHLAERGFSALLYDVERVATYAGAPFFHSDIGISAARSQWSNAFDVVSRLGALEDAIGLLKQGLASRAESRALNDLKRERDLLRRAISSRQIWSQDRTY